jgi:SAM-dependent methyltransferase
LLDRRKYGRGDDYDAAAYWGDRLAKYGHSLKGAGHEGLSEEVNVRMYKEAADVFTDLCRKEGIDLGSASVLDIGCGSGFYTQLLRDLGVKSYRGLDITDVLFPSLREKYPHFEFVEMDIASDELEGEFDLIIMIDVVEHIVKRSKLAHAMMNVKKCLSADGVFIISGVRDVSGRRLFYVRSWSVDDIRGEFSGYSTGDPVEFRDAKMFSIRRV